MKTNIRNTDDLRAERARLKNEIQLTKTKMRDGIDAIKEDLSPARHAVNFLGDFLTNRNKGLLNMGVGIGVDAIIRNGILRSSPWPLKALIPFFLKNYAGNMILKNKDAIVDKGLNWVKNVTDEKPVLTEINGIYVEEYKPSLVEKALIWVKDVTEEKPNPPKNINPIDVYRPSFIERSLMWVKDVTDEKPKVIKAVSGPVSVTALSE